MSDELLYTEDRGAVLGEIVAALDMQLAMGHQYYTMLAGRTWLVFYNSPALIH